jgi:hypothetical protein
MGAEARATLAEAVREDAALNLAEAIMARFQGLEADLELPARIGELPSSIREESRIELINPWQLGCIGILP